MRKRRKIETRTKHVRGLLDAYAYCIRNTDGTSYKIDKHYIEVADSIEKEFIKNLL